MFTRSYVRENAFHIYTDYWLTQTHFFRTVLLTGVVYNSIKNLFELSGRQIYWAQGTYSLEFEKKRKLEN